MQIIDCSCSIGFKTINYEVVNHEHLLVREKVKQVRDAEELLIAMDYCGVDRAIVGHNTMADVDPDYGNRALIAETAKAPERLIPTWTILPSITEEQYAPEHLFPAMKASGVKLLRAYPERNRYLLNGVVMGDLLQELVAAQIPLYLSSSEGWDGIYQVLQEYPDLTVILYNYGLWSHSRLTFPLLKTYKNFYIETGDMQTAGEIREICNKFGSERLLFGSEFPSNGIGGPLATLFGSGIATEHLENIAYRNAERMLSEVKL
jgi:predicted TIM-barrel fold metal-dependent hydrolase